MPESNIIAINFESLRYEALRDFRALYAEISRRAESVNGMLYVLLDEIQEVESWEKVINSLRVDFNCDIYVTGSNATLLSGELATLLAGRYVEIRVYPLDFQEYLDFAAANPDEAGLSRQELFADFLRFDGLPGIHQMKWEEGRIMQYLQDIYNSVLLKDVIARNRIRDTALLEGIVLYLMDNIGTPFSAKSISDFLKSQGRKLSTETVYHYLKALENAFLIHKVRRFDIKGRRILENTVYLELLRRGWNVHIGKQGVAEVDFVAGRTDERLYIQVCYVLTPENMDREFGPLEAIPDNYEKLVLSTDTLLRINRGGIRQKNIMDFLLES